MNRWDLGWALLTVFFAGVVCGLDAGVIIATHQERTAWAEDRMRVTADHKVEQWHAPLKPGDAGWWEAAK